MTTFLLASSFLVFGINFELSKPDPYVGWAIGVSSSKGNEEASKKRQQMWSIGLPFSYAYQSFKDRGRIDLVFLPEISFHPEYLQLVLATGPEQEINLGPSHQPLLVVIGGQLGMKANALLQTKNYLDDGGGSMTPLKRMGVGFLGNFYVGPHWAVFGGQSLGLRFQTQLAAGVFPRHSIRSDFSRNLSWTMGAHLQFRFR